MKSQHTRNLVNSLLVVNLCLFMVLILLGSAHAKPLNAQGPPFSFPGGKRGQEAVLALHQKLPDIASHYGRSPEKLQQAFLQDRDLWLDPVQNLLYICNFDVSEIDTIPESSGSPIPAGPFPPEQTFQLHSLPGASKVLYLDFDGHLTSGTLWNANFTGGSDITSLPYGLDDDTSSFSSEELSRIQNIWARVAEDFAIYEIDVTTEDPGIEALRRSESSDEQYGVRVVISPSSSWYGNSGGVAYVGSFSFTSDTPAFVFSNMLGNGSEKYVTDAASHEAGHTLGLFHDGVTGGTAYYGGHGSWAPIMGSAYSKSVSQWSKGEYAGANNTQDDLSVMLNYGVTYRQDEHGNWIDTATALSGDTLDSAGIIEKIGDTDVFAFTTATGNVSISVDPANLDPNLDILFQVLDDGGNVISQDDPYYILPASLDLNLPAGTYYILVTGIGTGDPDTGYTDYASLGQYYISWILPNLQFPPAAPTGLSAAPASSSSINLVWTDNSVSENGFFIDRSQDSGATWTQAGFAAANATSYTDTGLATSTTYHYRVAAYNIIGDSGYSNTASAITFDLPPAAPSALQATPLAAGQIQLDWADNSGNETGFAIERSANGTTGWQEIVLAIENTTTYQDTGLAPGTSYFYRVLTYNQNGNSGYSNTASATTAEVAPDSPFDLTAVTSSANEIDLSWQDNSGNETGFWIERSPNGSDSWAEIAMVAGNVTGYGDSSVSPATTYYYRVYAYNAAGNSGYSNTVAVTTDELPQFIEQPSTREATVAGTVTNTYLETQANDSILETITEETSGGRPSSRYSYLDHKWIFQVEAGSGVTLFANAWASGLGFGDSLVFSYSTDDETYTEMFAIGAEYDDDTYHTYPLPENFSGTLYIRAADTLRSPGSYERGALFVDHLFVRTDNYSGTPPAAPGSLAASGAGYESILLSWDDAAANELGYMIERSTDPAGGWEQVASAGPDTQTYTDTGLSPDSTYYYRVQAFNGAGFSDYSPTAWATTGEANALHVAALESYVEMSRKKWESFVVITVREQNESPVADVTVEGLWDDGSAGSCVTDGAGQCTISTRLKSTTQSAGFSVTNLVKNDYVYDSPSNVDHSIVVTAPSP